MGAAERALHVGLAVAGAVEGDADLLHERRGADALDEAGAGDRVVAARGIEHAPRSASPAPRRRRCRRRRPAARR